MAAFGRWTTALLLTWLVGVPAAGRAQDMRTPTPTVPSITVQGGAMREVQPDLAIVSIGVSTERATAAEAAAQNNKVAGNLVDEIKAMGIADTDVVTTEVSLTPIFDTRDGTKVKGFRAANHLAVKVRALPTVGDVIGRLVDKGANAIEGVDFIISDPQPILDQLRADATHDALHKARVYADAAGVVLGSVLEILPENNLSAPSSRLFKVPTSILAAAPTPPVQAGTKTLEAQVRITLALTH